MFKVGSLRAFQRAKDESHTLPLSQKRYFAVLRIKLTFDKTLLQVLKLLYIYLITT